MTILVAHVSDTHFGGPPDARARAEAVLAHLLALDPRPDVLLVTGDVADHGTAGRVRRGAHSSSTRGPAPCWSAPATTTSADRSPGRCSTARPTGPLDQVLETPGCGC